MGVWMSELYQNDLAEELRDYYIDRLKNGIPGEQITQELITEYADILTDSDDAPVFWFALADTQWNFGRLEPFVKDKALSYLREWQSISCRSNESPKQAKKRQDTLLFLEKKLISDQPNKKRVARHRLYKCEWSVGDVFALQLNNDLASEKGLRSQFILIQKIDEMSWHPGHIVPIVYFKITADAVLPSNIDEYNKAEYVQVGFTLFKDRFLPIDMTRPEEDIAEKSRLTYPVDEFGLLQQFRAVLLNTSKRVIPPELIYVGNFIDAQPPVNEFVPHSKLNYPAFSWSNRNEKLETRLINLYYSFNCKEHSVYKF